MWGGFTCNVREPVPLHGATDAWTPAEKDLLSAAQGCVLLQPWRTTPSPHPSGHGVLEA